MADNSTTVAFTLTSSEPRAWLVLKGDHQEPRVVEMRQRGPGIWSASEDLIPDEYYCRYYCGDDVRVFYEGPAHTEGGALSGMDTVLSVASPLSSGNPNFI